MTGIDGSTPVFDADRRLSYKFQRLRERLRTAIDDGSLSGKLPGERQLAKQFRVNAKTLSKALTDLASEGLLERTIGRGTFVRGQPTTTQQIDGHSHLDGADKPRWLVIADDPHSALVDALVDCHAEITFVKPTDPLRPSFLLPFKAALIASKQVPDRVIRDLLIRNLTVVLLGREPNSFSCSALLVDVQYTTSTLARNIIRRGHRRAGLLEVSDDFAEHLTAALTRDQELDVRVERGTFEQALAGSWDVAVFENFEHASFLVDAATRRGIRVPEELSIVASGVAIGSKQLAIGGCMITAQQVAASIEQLVEQPVHRPLPIWLIGSYDDRSTIGSS